MNKINPVNKRKTVIAWILVVGLAVICIGLSLYLQQNRIFGSELTTPQFKEVQINTREVENPCADGIAGPECQAYLEGNCTDTLDTISAEFYSTTGLTLSTDQSAAIGDIQGQLDAGNVSESTASQWISTINQNCSVIDTCADAYAQLSSLSQDQTIPALQTKLKELQTEDLTPTQIANSLRFYRTDDAGIFIASDYILQSDEMSDIADLFDECAEDQAAEGSVQVAQCAEEEQAVEEATDIPSDYSWNTSGDFAGTIRGYANNAAGQNNTELATLYGAWADCLENYESVIASDPCGQSTIDSAVSAGHPEIIDYINYGQVDKIKEVSASLEREGNSDASTAVLQCASYLISSSSNGTDRTIIDSLAEEAQQTLSDLASKANKYYELAQTLAIAGSVLDALGLNDLAQAVYGIAGYYMIEAQAAQDDYDLAYKQALYEQGLLASGIDTTVDEFASGLPTGITTDGDTVAEKTYSPNTVEGINQYGSYLAQQKLLEKMADYTKTKGIISLLTNLVTTFSDDEKTLEIAENISTTANDWLDTMLEVYMIRHGLSYGYSGYTGGSTYDQYGNIVSSLAGTTGGWYSPYDYVGQIVADVLPVNSSSSSSAIILHYAVEDVASQALHTVGKFITPWGNAVAIQATTAAYYNLINSQSTDSQ